MSFSKDFRSNPSSGLLVHRVLTFVCEQNNLSLDEVWATVSDRSVDQLRRTHRRQVRRNDPVASVKKARSAYSYFTAAQRGSIVKSNPNATFGDVSKLISAKWRKMSDRAKRKYNKMSTEDKARYQREVAEVCERHGIPTKQEAANRPKKPLTAFFIYQREVRQEITKGEPKLKPPQVAKEASRRWKALNTKQRSKYEKLAVADRARYQREKAAAAEQAAAAPAAVAAQ